MTRFYHKKTQAWANNSTSPCYTTKTRRFRNYLCMNLWKSRPSCTTRVRVKYLYTFTTSLNIILGRKLFGHLFFLYFPYYDLIFLVLQFYLFGRPVVVKCARLFFWSSWKVIFRSSRFGLQYQLVLICLIICT